MPRTNPPSLYVQMHLTDEEADELVAAFPRATYAVEAARLGQLRQRAGVTYGTDDVTMPLEIFVVEQLGCMWWWNAGMSVVRTESQGGAGHDPETRVTVR